MSATQDKSQRTTFVFNNLYHLYKKKGASPVTVQTAETTAPVISTNPGNPGLTQSPSGLIKGVLLKASVSPEKVQVYRPVELFKPTDQQAIQKPSDLPALSAASKESSAPIEHLKKNLNELQDLHERLKFMLKEIEELTKKS